MSGARLLRSVVARPPLPKEGSSAPSAPYRTTAKSLFVFAPLTYPAATTLPSVWIATLFSPSLVAKLEVTMPPDPKVGLRVPPAGQSRASSGSSLGRRGQGRGLAEARGESRAR